MRVVRLPPLPRLPSATILAGVELRFERGWRTGVPVGIAEIADDHPQAAAVAMQVAMMPRQYEIGGADLMLEGAPVPVAPVVHSVAPAGGLLPISVSVAASAAAPPDWTQSAKHDPIITGALEAAARNGWTYGDCTGTGEENDPGKGRSSRTALTLAEMALTSAPPKWADKYGEGFYPWELEGWQSPGMGWVAPTVPERREKAKPAEPVATPDVTGSPDVPPGDLVNVAVVDPDQIDKSTSEPVLTALPPTGDQPPGAKPIDVLEGWGTANQVAEARAVLQTLMREAGKAPSVSKAKFHLERLSLPKVNAAQLAALIA